MARRGPEGKIQDAVIRYAREKYGALCKKNEVGKFFVGSGWPDYFILFKGLTFFHEYKRMGGKLTAMQNHIAEQLRAQGFEVELIDSIEKGKASIDAHCQNSADARAARDSGRRR